MKGVFVPELRRKLDLLIETGCFADRAELHHVLGRNETTVRGWINGGSGQPPDTIPQKAFGNVLQAFAIALPLYSNERIRDLLCGPLNDLEQTLTPASELSLSALIVREANTSSITLITEERGALGIARRAKRYEPAPQHTLSLGQWFRMEIGTRSRATCVLALQNAPSGWVIQPSMLDRDRLLIHVPGPDEKDETGYLTEENEIGRHQFIVAQCPLAFPAALLSAAHDGIILERGLVGQFADHYQSQPKTERRLFAVEVEFFRVGDT